ncbi:MAG: sigma-70 family RNA polymerase sigma factor [Eubacteriales bacterium]|nr:sigma-70 family RNA polymerase sigma factor [Eubacteriales bacterium]
MANEKLCALAQKGDIDAQNKLIENNLGIINGIAKKGFAQFGLAEGTLGIDYDDLVQEGCIGLWKCVEKFDAGKGNKFMTYATPSIENTMVDLIRSQFATFESKLTGKDEFAMTRVNLDDIIDGEDKMLLAEVVADPYAKSPAQIVIEEETREELHAALRALTDRERNYLLYRFGFEDDIEHPLIATAAHFHLSESRAKSIEKLALDNVWLELPWWYEQHRTFLLASIIEAWLAVEKKIDELIGESDNGS